MTQVTKRVFVDGDGEDRISTLPTNTIDRILELLPVEDAARTCILSKQWRYNWSMLPNLVLDNLFFDKFTENHVLVETVDKILLQHTGDIVKFDLVVSDSHPHDNRDIDSWMLFVTGNGVKELTFNNSRPTTYKLPFCVFNCSTLTHMKLFNCVFKPPNSFIGFENLKTLYLERVTIMPTAYSCAIKASFLVSLTLTSCNGTEYLNIVSPKLETLIASEIPHFMLNCPMNWQYLRELHVYNHNEGTALVKLLCSLATTLEILHLASSFLQFLLANSLSKAPPLALNSLRDLSLMVEFGCLSQISSAIQLIKRVPNLSKLILVVGCRNDDNDVEEAVLKYLDTRACLDRTFNNLKHVVIHSFNASKSELHFIKILLACTPSLCRMSLKQGKPIGLTEETNINIELMRLPRASPKAELHYIPYPSQQCN